MMEMYRAALCIGAAFLFFFTTASAQPVSLVFPTDNDALLRGGGPEFYMYTNRTFEGVRSKPWQGGQYGFVRNEERTPAGIVFTRFHEGVDIRPLYRDARGEPLDEVRAADGGRVVYVNHNPRQSAYGIYVVVEHLWQDSPYYTLYGHLAHAVVREGQSVARGGKLGRLGYTGTGINQERAHVHFEVNLLLSNRFDAWLRAWQPRSNNPHGLFHGLNLAGADVSRLYLALAEESDVQVGEVIQREPVAWKALVPGGFIPELVQRYPWLTQERLSQPPSAWMVHVSSAGLPLRFEPVEQQVTAPVLVYIADPVRKNRYSTNSMLKRTGDAFVFTDKGLRHLKLITQAGASIGAPATAW